MQVHPPPPCCGARIRNGGVNLLLVSRDRAWLTAVRRAARRLGGGGVVTCGGRDALARLAGCDPHYSHLLVDCAAAEGLFDELADLATEVACPDTDMLVLGRAAKHRPRVRAIQAATTRSVLEALTAEPLARDIRAIDLADLQAALDGARIETRYQPVVRFADRRAVGLEALARINHPRRGTLPPDRFMPMVEDAGLAERLTALVSDRALADMAGAVLAEHGLSMALNFPLDVLLCQEALDRLEAARSAAGVLPGRIVIELTESRPVQDFATLRQALETVRTRGYRVVIDDVGPAVPRLAPLLELPFTGLKLDKELVQKVTASADAAAFLRQTIGQAKAHGLTVVAEGVETGEIWAAMHDLGADEAQGFLAARPLPVAAVPIWLEHWANPVGVNPL